MAGASVNKVILMGNLGGDPELRYTSSGKAVATFTVATTSSYSREREPQTEWHRIVTWDKLAEQVKQYLYKGRQVYLEGRLQTRAWEDRTGQKRYTTEIVARQVLFLGGGQGRARAEGYNDEPPHPGNTSAPSSKDGYGYPAESPPAETEDIPDSSFGSDDDIPF